MEDVIQLQSAAPWRVTLVVTGQEITFWVIWGSIIEPKYNEATEQWRRWEPECAAYSFCRLRFLILQQQFCIIDDSTLVLEWDYNTVFTVFQAETLEDNK